MLLAWIRDSRGLLMAYFETVAPSDEAGEALAKS